LAATILPQEVSSLNLGTRKRASISILPPARLAIVTKSVTKCQTPETIASDVIFVAQHFELFNFLKRGAAKRVHLEQLPGYAPDLNPDKGIWNSLKRVELGNVSCSDLDQLYRKLIQAKERLRHKKEIIKSCSRKSRLLGLVS
jgi:hypothetical protein